jgi:plasmid stability protein
MSVNLSVKNVPDEIVERLRERAKLNHRSLQGEVLTILEGSVGPRKLTMREALERIKALNFKTKSDSTQMIREDRDAR